VSIPKDMHFGIASPATMTFGFANASIWINNSGEKDLRGKSK
jgi:hypothetical protein